MKIIIRESKLNHKFLYHNSPNPDIDVFVPRTIWRNEDWSVSGADENPEFVREDVVFAIDKNKALFYSLPRDTPRILLNQYHKEAKQHLGLNDKLIMILSKKDENEVMNHSWTEYKFDAASFKKLPTDEWVSYDEVRPISKKTYKNSISSLEGNGYKIIWVDDVKKLAHELIRKKFGFDAENI